MNHFKFLGLVTGIAISATVLLGASTASATILSVEGLTKNESVAITATLAAGTSSILRDEGENFVVTCTTSEFQGKTEGTFQGETVGGALSKLTFGSCGDSVTVLKPGRFTIRWISGSTNGTVTSTETEVKVQSTPFGTSATCKTGTGTDIGTLTGTNSGYSTIDVNAKINCGILGNSSWTGTYTVTSPKGLAVEEIAPPKERH